MTDKNENLKKKKKKKNEFEIIRKHIFLILRYPLSDTQARRSAPAELHHIWYHITSFSRKDYAKFYNIKLFELSFAPSASERTHCAT